MHIIYKQECMRNVCIHSLYTTRPETALHRITFTLSSLFGFGSCAFDICVIWQVNFAYKEAGESKQALVKLRLCPKHALQLNFKQNEQLLKKRKRDHDSTEKTADARKHVEGVSKQDAASPDDGVHKHKVRSERKGKDDGASDSLLDELFM